jgi:hypothetical protein
MMTHLFVAENNPALRDLENPVMMREFGLIKLNSDGFDKPAVVSKSGKIIP